MLTGNQTRIGYGRNNVWTGSQVIQVGRSDMVGLTVKGTTSQSANLMEWRNVSNSLVASLSASGSFTIAQLTGSANQTVIATGNGWRFTPGSAANPPIVARGAASQSGNLQEWQDSAGTVLSYVNSSGGLYGSTLTLTGTTVSLTSGSDIFFTASGGSSAITLWARGGGATAPKLQLGNAGNTSTLTGTTLSITSPLAASVVFVVKGAASQTANLQEWQNSSGVSGAIVNSSLDFSRPNGTNSEQFGSGASASAQNGLAIGKNATASVDYCTAIGYNASAASGNTAVAIGTSASTTGNGAVCVGYSATGAGVSIGHSATSSAAGVAVGASANGGPSGVSVGQSSVSASSCVAVGIAANASSQNAVSIGTNSTAGAQGVAIGTSANAVINNISIGYDSDAASYAGALAIGYQATCTANNQAVIGSAVHPTSDFYFGKGITHATPTAVTFNGTGGSGTNIAGANIIIAGGKGTGSGVGGNILFQTSLAGASSSTLRSLTTIATISQTTQNVLIQTSAVGTIGLVVKGTASQTASLQEWQNNSSTVLSTISENGYFTTRLNTAPADGELANGEAAYWFDSTNGAAKFMIKAKTADGTVVTGSINLT